MLIRQARTIQNQREPTLSMSAVEADRTVILTLTVPQGTCPTLCDAIDGALCRQTEVYTTAADRLTGYSTLQLLLRSEEIDHAMKTVMATVPRAKFGYIQNVACTAVH